MHFAVDYMASQWEIAAGTRCFWSAWDKLRDQNLGYPLCEEGLANGYMLRGFRFPSQLLREPGAFGLLRDFVATMPPGYRDGIDYIGKRSFEAMLEVQSLEFEGCLDRRYRAPFPQGFDHLSFYPFLRPIDWRYCSILLDSGRKAVPISLRIITSINMIGESPRFEKRIRRMGHAVRRAWNRVKDKLRISTQIPGLDFKSWGQDVFSVRVNDSVRAHLRLSPKTGDWVAEAIGSHKEMGHG